MENKQTKVNLSSFDIEDDIDIYEDIVETKNIENNNNLRWSEINLPAPSHFRQHVWNDRQMDNKQTYGRNGNFYIGNIGLKNGKGVAKFYSQNENEYIDGEWKEGQITKLHACQFIGYTNGNQIHFIRIYGHDNVITFNDGNFIGRFKNISTIGKIDFNRTFNEIKRVIFDTIEIVKILEDDKLTKKKSEYETLKTTITSISQSTSKNINNAEDLFHVLVILVTSKRYTTDRKYSQFDSNKFILNSIIKHNYISNTLKLTAQQILNVEEALQLRYNHFPKLHPSVIHSVNLIAIIEEISRNGLEKHKNELFSTCGTSTFIGNIVNELEKLLRRDSLRILCLSCDDIELFTYMSILIDQQKYLIKERKENYVCIYGNYLKYLWLRFIQNVNSINTDNLNNFKNVVPLTSCIFVYLFKSFQELTIEIDRIVYELNNGLLINTDTNGNIALKKDIIWPGKLLKYKSLEYQWYFIHDTLMKHFSPEFICANKSKFEYKFKIIGKEPKATSRFNAFVTSVKNMFISDTTLQNMNDDQLVWLFIFDKTVSKLYKDISDKSKPILDNLINSLIKGYINFIQQNAKRYESFRIGVHNIIKFIVHVSSYLDFDINDEQCIMIINKQVELINYTINFSDSNKLSDYFTNLIDIFNEFWENKKNNIDNLYKKFPCYWLQEQLKDVTKLLLTLLDTALKINEPQINILITFLRTFNEFTLTLKQIELNWYIKSTSISSNQSLLEDRNLMNVVDNKLKDEDKRSYIITDPSSLVDKLNEKGDIIPQLFCVDIIKELLNITIDFLNGSTQLKFHCNISERLKLTNSLILAIDKSFLYLKEQADYRDFQLFYDESIYPFKSVINKCDSFADFEKSIGTIKESFWFFRKQDEIGINEALDLYKSLNSDYNSSMLKECYNKYLKQFNSYIENISNFFENESRIINDVNTFIKNECKIQSNECYSFDKWTTEFKTETIPKILAGLSAVWSLNESKNIMSIQGKCLKPHCLQILSIFRLLSVDISNTGVEKHLAQISTGQGKSIVLGLLSLLLSLLGYKIQTVCYSAYLSERDQNAFNYLFQKFSKSSGYITYGTFENMANNVIKCTVNGISYGIRDLIKEQIMDENNKTCGNSFVTNNVSNTILLIDEVDVFFTDQFYGSTYRACSLLDLDGLKDIQIYIWNLVHEDGNTDKNTIKKLVQEYVQKILIKNTSRKFCKFYEKIKSYYLFEKEYTNKRLFDEQLDVMIKNALDVESTGDDDDFRLDDDGYITLIKSNGVYTRNTISEYKNTFHYFRLKQNNYDDKNYDNYGYLNLSSGKISYANLPKEYPLILGVSGTLSTLSNCEKHVIENTYNIKKISIMPSFFGHSNLKFNSSRDFQIKEDIDSWLLSIFTSIDEHIKQDRAILVAFDTETNLKKFQEKYENKIGYLQALTINTKNKDWIINESGITKKCTLITREMGRGVDYKSSVTVENHGGVHVIQTFCSMDVKEEVQIKGRTARKDNKGTYELILCRVHLKKLNISEDKDNSTINTYSQLCKERERIADQSGKHKDTNIKECEIEHNKTMTYLKSFFS